MAEDATASTGTSNLPPTTKSPVPTNSLSSFAFDGTSPQITLPKLNGANFREWSQSVMLVIKGKGKIGYLTGETTKPSSESVACGVWEAKNAMVMAWLVNSMEPKVGRTYLFYKTTSEIWNAVREIYSDLENTAQSFQVRSSIRSTKQGTNTVTEYYNTLVELWQEMDLFHEITWESSADGRKYDKIVEKERIFDFLYGLNSDLDEVRGWLLGTKPFPSMKEVFAEVRREESRKKVMLPGVSASKGTLQSSALNISRGQTVITTKGEMQRDKQWCNHCNKPYHTKDTCWKLHGKPANWKPRNQRKGMQSAYMMETEKGTPAPVSLTPDQLEVLQ